MSTEEPDYSLEESFRKLGVLPIPKLADSQGHMIDGEHRDKIGAEVPTVKLPVKNPLQFHIIRLVVNCCRRNMSREEITSELTLIGRLSGWKAPDFVANLPFKKSWIYEHLPDEFKTKTWKREHDVTPIPQHGNAHEDVKSLALGGDEPPRFDEPSESEEDFAKRFTPTFLSHLTQLKQKDLPIIVTHMSEEHNCNECSMMEACARFLELIAIIQKELPPCMQKKLGTL